MSARHLSCTVCRIRLHATAAEIDLLEGRCPVCGARLKLASSVSDLTGFRLFDLAAFSDHESSKPANSFVRDGSARVTGGTLTTGLPGGNAR